MLLHGAVDNKRFIVASTAIQSTIVIVCIAISYEAFDSTWQNNKMYKVCLQKVDYRVFSTNVNLTVLITQTQENFRNKFFEICLLLLIFFIWFQNINVDKNFECKIKKCLDNFLL